MSISCEYVVKNCHDDEEGAEKRGHSQMKEILRKISA
jgi:hypothetical protein